MKEAPFSRDNHYVPCVYLRGFAGSGERIFVYRTLVSRPEIPLWRERQIKGIAYLSHLYTRIIAGSKTDEIEKWLEREFETPAAEPLRKATSGRRLTPDDWQKLVQLLAAQIVRTPAYFVKSLPKWHADVPGLLNSTLQEVVATLEAARQSGKPITLPEARNSEYLPMVVTAEKKRGHRTAGLKAETVIGRGVWFFDIRNALSQTVKVLHRHRWTVLTPAEDLRWFTSDDPVILLNYYSPQKYDFKGGWGQNGTEIFLPLSPRHLLYARVGYRPPPRGEIMSRANTEMIRHMIAEHAYRMIIAASPDQAVAGLRSRIVDEGLFRSEQEQWRTWHAEQTAAEEGLKKSLSM